MTLKGILVTSTKLVGVVGLIWVIGLRGFIEELIPSSPSDPVVPTDGIVVFTGDTDRVQEALFLFDQGKAPRLLISGVNPSSTLPAITESSYREGIILGYEALNTRGNADETAKWARQHHIKTLRLITSNYHMPRSLFELRLVLPNVEIIPHSVMKLGLTKPFRWGEVDMIILNLVVQEYNKFLWALFRHPFGGVREALSALGLLPPMPS